MIEHIRNFCIIAHIDHGKSTLADRLLELTHTVEDRKMQDQLLDSMDLERERGITIKMQPVRMTYRSSQMTNNKSQNTNNEIEYELNLIDTPGHVDFGYEVSRSLAAVEGALLVVDAAQGVQAQTIANLHLAIEQGLEIIPVINKIDMPAADVPRVEEEIKHLLYGNSEPPYEILKISAKTGQNIESVVEAVIEHVPAPVQEHTNTQALIFDSVYDTYQGVVAHIRVFNGSLKRGDKIYLPGSANTTEVLEVGIFQPQHVKVASLDAGEIGYMVTGLKDLQSVRVGDTVISEKDKDRRNELRLAGYTEAKPMVFSGIYCNKTEEHEDLREALEKINLNDASFTFTPERSDALGPGYRAGFLGLLHLDIIKERISREFDLDIIITTPSVEYRVKCSGDDELLVVRSPQELPDPSRIDYVEEPWVSLEVVTPTNYIGNIMQLTQERRGEYRSTEYLDQTRVILKYFIPLSSILTDFYDKLKGVSQGYASLSWEFHEWRQSDIIRMDILVAEEKQEALSQLIYRPDAQCIGRQIVKKLKDILPRQNFMVKIQAAVGGTILASERLSAFRKDVTAKLYGGDITRKRKLLENQKKGKKKMEGRGRVEIPSNVYVDLLKQDE